MSEYRDVVNELTQARCDDAYSRYLRVKGLTFREGRKAAMFDLYRIIDVRIREVTRSEFRVLRESDDE